MRIEIEKTYRNNAVVYTVVIVDGKKMGEYLETTPMAVSRFVESEVFKWCSYTSKGQEPPRYDKVFEEGTETLNKGEMEREWLHGTRMHLCEGEDK